MSKNYYHYTSKEGAEAIERSGTIRESGENPRYAHFGPGVYVTGMKPSAGREQIVANNRNETNNPHTIEKHTHFVKIPAEYIDRNVERCNTERDVSVHRGEINLQQVPYAIGKVNKK